MPGFISDAMLAAVHGPADAKSSTIEISDASECPVASDGAGIFLCLISCCASAPAFIFYVLTFVLAWMWNFAVAFSYTGFFALTQPPPLRR